MKKLFIISILFLISTQVLAVEKIYIQQPSNNLNRGVFRPKYNPYSSPYNYRKYNQNNAKRIHRLNKIRTLNRLKNNFSNWSTGNMTGYSVPINDDIYRQMGISPMYSKQNSSSPTTTTDLFSSPIGHESYYNNGRFIRNLGGISTKTGVSIIYD